MKKTLFTTAAAMGMFLAGNVMPALAQADLAVTKVNYSDNVVYGTITNVGRGYSPPVTYSIHGIVTAGGRATLSQRGAMPRLAPGQSYRVRANIAGWVRKLADKSTVVFTVNVFSNDQNPNNNRKTQNRYFRTTDTVTSPLGADLQVHRIGFNNNTRSAWATVTNIGRVNSGNGRLLTFYYKSGPAQGWTKAGSFDLDPVSAQGNTQIRVSLPANAYAVKAELNTAVNDPHQNEMDLKVGS